MQLEAQLTWQATTAPVSSSHYSSIAIDNSGRIFAGIGGGGVYRSTDNGAGWAQLSGGLPADAIINSLAASSSGLVVAGAYAGVYCSTNNGDSWALVRNTETTAVVVAPDGSIIAGTVGGVIRSTDKGSTWSSNVLANPGIKSFSKKSDGKMFAAGGAVYLSTDNGASWAATTTGPIAPAALTVTPNGNVFAGGSGMFLSTNNGTTWTAVNTGLLAPMIKALASNSAGHIFAGTIMGVYRSTDSGTQWSISGVQYYLYSIAIAPNGFAYAGTEKNGLFTTTTATAGVNDVRTQPGSFVLRQNYPNPFNPSTSISFSLPRRSFASMKVFDLIGREIATIVSEELSAGDHSYQWNAEGFPSGVYFYRLVADVTRSGQAGSFAETKKLTLLR